MGEPAAVGPTDGEIWLAQLKRRHHAAILTDPVVRELDAELKLAGGGEPRELAAERMGPILVRLGERLGLGPRPR